VIVAVAVAVAVAATATTTMTTTTTTPLTTPLYRKLRVGRPMHRSGDYRHCRTCPLWNWMRGISTPNGMRC
jgi:hypothetical protein